MQSARAAAGKIRDSIRQNIDSYRIFDIENARVQIAALREYVSKITENFSDLIIIGMGGAILNPRTLVEFNLEANLKVRIHFIDNTDPIFLQKLLAGLRLQSCAVLAISNSGQTIETNSLVGVTISLFEQNNIQNFGKNFFFITNSTGGMLYHIGRKINATIISHTANISGRFSGLTNVTTFAGAIAGIDVEEYIEGAKDALDSFVNDKHDSSDALISAASIYSSEKRVMINIGYLQQFKAYLEWYSQIIAESLGKQSPDKVDRSIIPLHGLGPNDQHSMLQLYLEGADDKIYSLFYVRNIKSEFNLINYEELCNLGGKNLADINSINYKATLNALAEKARPLRIIELKDLSVGSMGALVVHSMLEIIILAHIMGINPFNQPGVELIKNNVAALL